ncbi:hypothetical protein KY362_03335 [Candidatus Woesearchaeota archaeon]|nr:hypothetical protein [Candidatus Woesearchaeota archaeon]
MGETIAIMFIFFILLIVAAVFYMNVQRSTAVREIGEAYELRSVELSQIISFLPEVQCTEFNIVQASCFDLYKMMAMSAVRQDPKVQDLYMREFGTTTIRLVEVYPAEAEWVLYDNAAEHFTSAPITHIPISLYNATADEFYFGVLEITTYQGVYTTREDE